MPVVSSSFLSNIPHESVLALLGTQFESAETLPDTGLL